MNKTNGRQAHRFLVELHTVRNAEKRYALRHEDYVMEMPQSGERPRGRENMRRFQESRSETFPSPRASGKTGCGSETAYGSKRASTTTVVG